MTEISTKKQSIHTIHIILQHSVKKIKGKFIIDDHSIFGLLLTAFKSYQNYYKKSM